MIFRTTRDILKTPWEDELFDVNWMDSDKVILPPTKNWDYKKVMQLEDVVIWEQIAYQGGGFGLYASWDPYAEFYMVTSARTLNSSDAPILDIETFYGEDAGKHAYKKAVELGIHINVTSKWVEPDDMWLYPTTKIISNN
jgi:hypothetical protein